MMSSIIGQYSFTNVFGGLMILSIITSGLIIFLENRDPSRTLAWLLLIYIQPIIGIIIYLIFGQNIRKNKIRRIDKVYKEYLEISKTKDIGIKIRNEIKNQLKLLKENKSLIDGFYHSEVSRKIMKINLNTSFAPITLKNDLTLFHEGISKFESLIKDIENAKRSINIEYFIIKKGEIGERLKNALIKKAKENVRVRVLYDEGGCWRLVLLHQKYFRDMIKAGIEVKPFLPSRLPFMARKLNYRNHRKIAVIDGNIGYVGGINVGDEYCHKSPRFGFWRDTHMRIYGKASEGLNTIFITDWYIATGEVITEREVDLDINDIKGTIPIQIISSGPDTKWESIKQAFFTAITNAKKCVYIYTPYFVPDEAMLSALKNAILSGVDVKIMFPSISDHRIVHKASYTYFEDILRSGGKIYLYKKGFLHSKTVIVDDDMASVGTTNMDVRSFNINFEVNGFIYDTRTVDELKVQYLKDLQDCVEFTYQDYKDRSILEKIQGSAARLFSPIL
ncbi:cardiolipin synthase Cls [Gottschalkia purinilytica]|uniref:Cardiolipin synthase n=1 Tax=Gottschalkia purinilytica TaxID=1503 RepID=A0A0L0WAB6_GOTPU|nr:cardiolipin synthase [Gottschalkia purinilytica]KNF08260.1 cardiolipin synthase Cls [Gottschalkia purinilytica]